MTRESEGDRALGWSMLVIVERIELAALWDLLHLTTATRCETYPGAPEPPRTLIVEVHENGVAPTSHVAEWP